MNKENHTAKHFYIFRHGECPFNLSGHIQGQRFNGRLTERGRQQAVSVGKRLRGRDIEIIVSSPMTRALQTAKIVRQIINDVPILVDNRLIEVNMGVVEGMHISVAEKRYSELYRHWRSNNPQDRATRFANGETKAEVRQRIFEALNYYARETAYRRVAVSGHGITISQLLLHFDILRSDIPNGAILHLGYHQEQWSCFGFINSEKDHPDFPDSSPIPQNPVETHGFQTGL